MIAVQVKERPILFSAPMVQAILEGRKTQTRRICKVSIDFDIDNAHAWEQDALFDKCPYGKIGEHLWIRETWGKTTNINKLTPWPDRPHILLKDQFIETAYIYRADGEWQWTDDDGFTTERSYWKPSIHMPRLACRLVLEITDVRVERLQDISEQEAIAEGIKPWVHDEPGMYWNYLESGYISLPPKQSFESLWHSINGPESWQANPWVWVLSFKIVELNGEVVS